MVQKRSSGTRNATSEGKRAPGRRGRPPAYDADAALAKAAGAFWETGYAATSLDDLSAATGMHRPSLYGAFGDKRSLYLATVQRYRDASMARTAEILAGHRPLREELASFYAAALATYLAGPTARGCFVIGTATSESVADPEIRARLLGLIHDLDAALEARIKLGRTRGEVAGDPAVLANLASAVLHTLAVRSRAGESRRALEAIAQAGVEMICGASKRKQRAAECSD
jgi:AcrR family transcriptional regulator